MQIVSGGTIGPGYLKISYTSPLRLGDCRIEIDAIQFRRRRPHKLAFEL
jgi:hypothetical protein